MKNQNLSYQEKMGAIADCLRDIMSVSITDRNIPNLLNRGKVVAQIVTADQREQILEAKRQAAQIIMLKANNKVVKKLKKAK